MIKSFFTGVFTILYLTIYGQVQFEPQPDFFRTKRDLPLLSIGTAKTITILEFGGIPNDGMDDYQAIKNAFVYAENNSTTRNPVRIEFSTGTYDIVPPPAGTQAFTVSLKYVFIEGNNAEIIIHNPEKGFIFFGNSTNVIIKNLKIDYKKLPFTQGKVTAVNVAANTFDFTIDEGFPSLDEAYFKNAGQKWGMLKKASGQLKEGVDYLFPYYGWTKISENVFRISQPWNNLIKQFDVGDYFVQIARNNGNSLFLTYGCKNLTFYNITSYASPTVTYAGHNNLEVNIINCNILLKSGRVQSANADCIHFSGSKIGPWVQGCLFEGYSDDVANLKHDVRDIISITAPNKIRIKYSLDAGDSIAVFNPRDGIFLGEVKVLQVQSLPNEEYEIILSASVKVTQVGVHQTADKLYVKNSSCESFVFRNNTFRNGRRYGLFLQSSYGIVENNIFENLSSCAIRMENGVDWKEGFMANNIVIRNNTFKNCGFDTDFISDPTSATISSLVSKLITPCSAGASWCGTEIAEWKGLKNITIENNTIQFNKCGLNLRNIDCLIENNNNIVHNQGDKTGTTPVSKFVDNCNLCNDPSTGMNSKKKQHNDLIIYPTLVNDFLYMNKMVDGVKIYNILAVCVYKENGMISKINLSFLPDGVYVVTAGGESKKIIKTGADLY